MAVGHIHSGTLDGTSEEHVEEDDELVDGVADDISHHDRRDDVLLAAVRLATQ